MAPIDFLSCLVSDELTRRGDRLLERRRKQAHFRDPQVTLDNFDFNFNKKMNRSLVFDLATCTFIARREDALFLGPPGTGKSHLAQAIGQAVIGQGYRVIYREAHVLLEKMQPRPGHTSFFRASRREWPSTSKSRRLDLPGKRTAEYNI
jgi:DNA replication protein DnaC